MTKHDDDDFIEQTWAKILPNLDLLFNSRHRKVNYVQLHADVIFDIYIKYCCTSDKNSVRHPGVPLYFKLKEYLKSYCNNLIQKSANLLDDDLLRFYVTEWEMYKNNYTILNGPFDFHNKYWIYRNLYEVNENPQSILHLDTLAIVIWSGTVFQTYNTRIVNIALKLIDRQRKGETIDTSIIQRLTSSYVNMEMCVDCKKSNLILYKEHFEKQLLKKSENFYDLESLALLKDNPLTVYLKWVDKRLNEEANNVAACVDPSSKDKLVKTVERSVIQNHLINLRLEFQELLKFDKNDDMKLLYSLVNRNPEDLEKFIAVFQKHVHSHGLFCIKKCGEKVKSDSNMFMEAILNVYKKYFNLVVMTFDNNVRFREAFKTACREFVNFNFTSIAPNTSRKPSELLAKYCDYLLKQPNSGRKEDIDNAQEYVMIVFKFILDKDVFEDCYMKYLAKRLVNQTSYDEDCETEMILKLKRDIGGQFTTKLEKMLSDVTVSMDISKDFAQSNTKSHKFDYKVMVLQFGSWPFHYNILTYTLPSELEGCIMDFNKFYTSKHTGKRLTWMYGLSKGEVVTTNFKMRYTFQSSTMEITILMLFNTSTTLSLAQIHEQSAIQMDSIKQIVKILLKVKILVTSDENVENLSPDTVVSVNEAYTNKKHRVNINLPIKQDVQREEEIVDKHIDDGRKFVIQATIGRIMKVRKSLKQSELISEVLLSLSGQFQPNIAVINKSIELLIQKNYIQRDSKVRSYTYVA